MSHTKGLLWQYAAEVDAAKEIGFFKWRQQQANCALSCKFTQRRLPMDVVYPCAGMGELPLGEKGFDAAHTERPARAFERTEGLAILIEKREMLGSRSGATKGQLSTLRGEELFHLDAQRGRIRAEDRAMNRLAGS